MVWIMLREFAVVMVVLLMTSSAYRQSAHRSLQADQIDPEADVDDDEDAPAANTEKPAASKRRGNLSAV